MGDLAVAIVLVALVIGMVVVVAIIVSRND